ncbi:hypothetical protein AB7828_03840 [Tardiphaga sp. 215_C5_N2_1]|uniref:hypothetical protein n=1 Tax=Tardiphaga sp. 215_C5_N2_1 TaxID=3240774 RepID=UPI003F893941
MAKFKIQIETVGEIDLRFTLDAFLTIGSDFGGFEGALAKVVACDLDTTHRIIAAAADQSPSQQAIFATGVLTLRPRILEYLELLQGGSVARQAAGYAETTV